MEASIAEHNIKTFVRILQCASKFGDELCMHATKDIWELAVTNSTKSAYFLTKLYPRQSLSDPGFFSRYRTTGGVASQRRGVKFRLLVKAVLAVISKASTNNTVDRIDFKLENPDAALTRRTKSSIASSSAVTGEDDGSDHDARSITARLEIKLICRHGVIKRHFLHLESTEFLRVDVNPDSTPSNFTIASRKLREWLDHFSVSSGPTADTAYRGENQLGWLFGRKEVKIRNWEGGHKDLCTEIRVPRQDFEVYDLFGDRVELTMPMKEFRAALQLADQLDVTITAAFHEANHPLTLTSVELEGEESNFEIFCAIATTASEVFTGVEIDGGSKVNGTALGGPTARIKSDLTDVNPTPRQPSLRPTGNQDSRQPSTEPSPARQRSSESQRPRTRPRLSMSAQPPPSPRRISQSNGYTKDEPLFLSGSQEDAGPSNSQSRGGPSDEVISSQMPALPASQAAARQMTQQEALAAAGMADLADPEWQDRLDDAEDEFEEQHPPDQGRNYTDDVTMDNESMAGRRFAPDHNIFTDAGETTNETVLFPRTSRSPSRSRSSSKSRGAASRASNPEEEYESEEEGLPSTQAPSEIEVKKPQKQAPQIMHLPSSSGSSAGLQLSRPLCSQT